MRAAGIRRNRSATRGRTAPSSRIRSAPPTGPMDTKRRRARRSRGAWLRSWAFAYEGEYDPLRPLRRTALLRSRQHVDERNGRRASAFAASAIYSAAWCPIRFVATKTITHPLLDAASRAPRGMVPRSFPAASPMSYWMASACSRRRTPWWRAADCWNVGPVRVKLATGIAGLGQFVVDDAAELARALDAIDAEEMARSGAVVEQNLVDVTTLQRRPGARGRCRLHLYRHATPDDEQSRRRDLRWIGHHRGAGRFRCAAGLEAIRGRPARDRAGTRVRRCSDAMLRWLFCVASQLRCGAGRRTRQVIVGRACSSNRGGWAARAARKSAHWKHFAPILRCAPCVRSSREVYGEAPALPANATVYFSGNDPHVGPLTKYAWTEPHDRHAMSLSTFGSRTNTSSAP